ncbi:MAG: NAD(P)H-dependent oxidoreductase [Flavipsychrobacter sp.]|nr:NAD(P)H-dependent oxidoreductase [Flavipsychrobacter sp.]
MNILAVSGSLNPQSSNSAILKHAAEICPAEMNIIMYDGLDSLPHFSPDRDFEHSPLNVQQLREQIKLADGVIICTPEYAFGMPGSLKNLLDWIVSSGEFVHKPVAAWSASPLQTGGSKAHAWLVQVLNVLTAYVVPESSLNIPFIKTRLDTNGLVSDPALSTSLQSALAALAKAINTKKDLVE